MVVSRWPLRMDLRKVLVEQLLHLRLVVEGLHLRRRAHQVEVDAALRLRREMRQAGESSDRLRGSRLSRQKTGECERSDALRSAREEAPASFLNRHFARDRVERMTARRRTLRCDSRSRPRMASRGSGHRHPEAESDRLDSRSFIQHLVEIQQLAGQHRQRGVLAAGERGVGLAFAVVQEQARILGMGAVVAFEIRRTPCARSGARWPPDAAPEHESRCSRGARRTQTCFAWRIPPARGRLPRTARRSSWPAPAAACWCARAAPRTIRAWAR